MARQQRQLHMQLYPNWTMRDSVASGAARKRRNKRDKAADGGIFLEATIYPSLSLSLLSALSISLTKTHKIYYLSAQNQLGRPSIAACSSLSFIL